jgi:hypothetical protein
MLGPASGVRWDGEGISSSVTAVMLANWKAILLRKLSAIVMKLACGLADSE